MSIHKREHVLPELQRKRLAVISFDNLGSEQDSFYAFGISADLASDLSRAGRINMAPMGDVTKVMNDGPSRDEIASRLGVRYLVLR